MKRFIQGEDRQQVTLLTECLDDYIDENNPVRVVEAFVEELDLLSQGFHGVDPAATGRPASKRLQTLRMPGPLRRLAVNELVGNSDCHLKNVGVSQRIHALRTSSCALNIFGIWNRVEPTWSQAVPLATIAFRMAVPTPRAGHRSLSPNRMPVTTFYAFLGVDFLKRSRKNPRILKWYPWPERHQP